MNNNFQIIKNMKLFINSLDEIISIIPNRDRVLKDKLYNTGYEVLYYLHLANYDNKYGMHSVHIPSLVAPRTGNIDGTGRTELYDKSEGYVIDVYENYIVVRGRDFVNDDYIPLGTYLLNTELVEIKAKTFIDSTGLIDVK